MAFVGPDQKLVLLDARITSSPDDGKGGPRQQWIDVSFASAPVALSYIAFRNYYCAAITISHTSMRAEGDPLLQLHMKGRSPTWQVVVPKLALMAAPHHEDDAERYHELTTSHFAPEFDHRRVTRLRICCLQPSPMWREYGLRDLRFYTIEQPPAPSLQAPPSLSPAQRELAETIVDQLIELKQIGQEIRETIAAAKLAKMRPSRVGGGGARLGGGRYSNIGGTQATARAGVDHDIVPYVVGEWNDELRLVSIDSLPRGKPSSSHDRRSRSSASSSHRDAAPAPAPTDGSSET